MSIPHKCPVCEGAGTTARPPYVAGDQETWTACDCGFPCHACKGSGIVWEDTTVVPELKATDELKRWGFRYSRWL